MIRTPSRKELLYARSAVVTAACAFGLQSIDLVCMDYKSQEILVEECREGREMGFTGKQAIHPNQIETIQKQFAPLPEGKLSVWVMFSLWLPLYSNIAFTFRPQTRRANHQRL